MASKRMKMRVKPSPEAVATTLELLRPYMVNLLAKEWDYMMKGEYFDPKPPRPAFLRNGAPNTSPPAPPSMSPALAIDETAAWEELRSLLVRVDMVGLTERMDETLLALQHFTGLPTVRLTRPFASTNANLSRLPPEVRQVEQQFLASLAAESTLDSTIYGEAQRLFQQNVVARVPDLPARLRQLRAEGRLDAPGQAPPPPWPPPNVTALLAADAAGNPIHEAQLASLSVTELRHLLYFRQPPPCVLALFIHLERTGGSTLGAYNILELNPLIYDSFHALAEPTQAVLRLAARNPLAFHERLGRVMLEYHGGQPHNYTAALALVRRLAAPGSAFAAAGCTALAFTHFRAPLGYLHSQVGTRWRYSIFAPRFDHHVRLNSTPEVWTQELIDMESRLLLGRYFAGALPNKEIHNFTQPLGPRALEAIKGVYALFDCKEDTPQAHECSLCLYIGFPDASCIGANQSWHADNACCLLLAACCIMLLLLQGWV